MKKIYTLLVVCMIILLISACGSDGVDTSKDDLDSGKKAWTVSKATYTYPNGKKTVCYTGELKDDALIISYLRELKEGEVNRDSMIIEYDANGITKLIEESQEYGKDVVRGEEQTITYDEATSTLTVLSMEDGKESSKAVYEITWDDEGRLEKYNLTSTYYYYNEDGSLNKDDSNEYKYAYTYAYGDKSFTITCDEVQKVSVNDERVEAIKRVVSTVPYDEKGDITTITSHYKMDGVTPLHTGWDEKKTVNNTVVSNWWGYEISNIVTYSDGTTENMNSEELTLDADGKILKKSYEKTLGLSEDGEKNTVTVAIDFTYDENGNLIKIVKDEEDDVTTIEFEWTEIPAKLDNQIAMMYGAPHWSAAEYIDNFVSFSWEGRLTVRTYKLSDFLSYVK